MSPAQGRAADQERTALETLLSDPDAGIDTGSGHVLDNTNWPRLHAAKRLISQLKARAALNDEDDGLLEGLLCFLDVTQDYAADTLQVPRELVFPPHNADAGPADGPVRTWTVGCTFRPQQQLLRVQARSEAQALELAHAQLSAQGHDIDTLSIDLRVQAVQTTL